MVLTAQVGYFSSYREFSRPLSHGGKEPKWQSYFDTFRAQKVKKKSLRGTNFCICGRNSHSLEKNSSTFGGNTLKQSACARHCKYSGENASPNLLFLTSGGHSDCFTSMHRRPY